jgi:hypothetical protein
MSDASAKRYGPVEWPDNVLDEIYLQPTDNDDSVVTTETVAEWTAYFDEQAESFVAAHKDIIQKATR